MFNKLNFSISIIELAIYFPCLLRFIYSVKWREMDKSIIGTLVSFLVCLILKVCSWSVILFEGSNGTGFIIAELIASYTLMFILYYLIYEMSMVHHKLQASTY